MIILKLTKRQVDAYWAMSALYSAEYESWRNDELSPTTWRNLNFHVPNINQKVREASR